MKLEWNSGLHNYRKHTLDIDPNSLNHTFTTELLDVELHNVATLQDALQMHVDGANLPIEVLYSGGFDSECVLLTLLERKIPVVVLTLRLLVKNAPINLSDLYYSEKFCREHQIKQNIIDFHIDKFYGNGDHVPYMEPYRFHILPPATIMWLIEQCTSFPVVGGDYTWPQTNIGKRTYSPHRNIYNCYDHFMQSRCITGIGNMLCHSLDANVMLIKEHLAVNLNDPNDKNIIFNRLGFNMEPRHRSHGWEPVVESSPLFDWADMVKELRSRVGETKNVIRWNRILGDVIDSEPGENDDFGIVTILD